MAWRQSARGWLLGGRAWIAQRVLIRTATVALLVVLLPVSLYFYHYMAFCSQQPGWTWPAAGQCAASGASERWALVGDPQIEGATRVNEQGLLGRLDLLFNDWYMHRIAANIRRFARPDVVVVLGDLFSHYKLKDEEFHSRAQRIHAIFDVPFLADAFRYAFDDQDSDVDAHDSAAHECRPYRFDEAVDLRGDSPKIVWLVGNHDIGYGKAVDERSLRRWQHYFGPANSVLRTRTGHYLVVVNSQTLEKEATRYPSIHARTHEFVETVALEPPADAPVVLLKHIPLHKASSMCHDAPLLKRDRFGVVVQNMMSPEVTSWLLARLRPALVFNGHDHEGCLFYHVEDGRVTPELTVRSMMGVYSGYALLVDVCRLDDSDGAFLYSFRECPFVSIRFVVALLCLWLLALAALAVVCAYPQLAKQPVFAVPVSDELKAR